MPVGAPGTFTTSGPLGGGGNGVPVASYSVEVSVPLFATHHGVAGPSETPQALTRFGSVTGAMPGWSETSGVTVYAPLLRC